MRQTTDARNRQIYSAFISGGTIEALALTFGLSQPRIKAILDDERHKIAVSRDPIYRLLRQSSKTA